MHNILTIDVEDWYHTKDFNFGTETWSNYENRVDKSTRIILDILDQYSTCATFFVLGHAARKNPLLVKEIAKRGHEVASHGMWHELVTRQTEQAFREDVVSSKKLLEDISGEIINKFRASSWSISSNTLWALEILEELGFICDSSIQPFWNVLSGDASMPCQPFHPVINGKKLTLLEFPQTVFELNKLRIPFSGGFYFRAMPIDLTISILKKVSQKQAAMMYLHPWEIDIDQPRLRAWPHIKFVHYYNIENNARKLQALLENFKFTSLGNAISSKKTYTYLELESHDAKNIVPVK